MAIASFVCGVIGLCASIVPFLGLLLAPPPAVLAIVLGGIGLWQAHKRGAPKRWALAGVICGIVALVIVGTLAELTNGWS